MSQSKEVLQSSGVSAPKDLFDLAIESPIVTVESPATEDLFADLTPSDKFVDAFEQADENLGRVSGDLNIEISKENGEMETSVDREGKSEMDEVVMAKALINGLHERENLDVVSETRTEQTDQRESEATGNAMPDNAVPHGEENHPSSGFDGQVVSHTRSHQKTDNGGGKVHGGGADEHRAQGGRPSDVPDNYPSRTPSGTSIVGDVLYGIASEDEEGRSRQRILAFAAKRYSNAVERNPADHDALYNWALVLQESADNTGPEVGNAGKDALLEEACKKYEAATHLCPTLHEAFYNWAIAISDRAKIRGRTKEAEDLWKQACERYDRSVQLNWNSPQALNNWGLALQELGAIVPIRDKRAIVKKAIRKFRAAIRLRFDFHRAVYNLGTVLYGLAEDTVRSGRKPTVRESAPNDLYSQSAIYIAAAHALKPDYPVYQSALRLVRSMLPLPYLKAGYLTVPPVRDSLAPHSDWQRLWFVLDHEALHEIEKVDRKSISRSMSRRPTGGGGVDSPVASTSSRPSVLRIEMEDIVFMTPCADLSLPPGGGFRIDTLTGHQFLIADTWESMDGWVDAIRLVYTIFARGKRDALGGVLAG
ncbi:hypothetical protein MPTK1_7g09430 [Marchantia polymorpha subsp. ruderalis]|uniref:PH domain-containing protein n=2 Tax=Marchantia polymorpha TaxID=3197 RepID=A0AAF6BXS1_MARPO|nr:hypothetical protein MARPO_0068s0096 [Marchantia polymorpha]BBN16805.1 hypothetical protein Mp_7g09430 [Marchantia polymorpha subsp. ruderalis]|eukprot:PTQ35888.1 hypothetical protein MARPO_0068s0096 [Marchantia polymorpha]